MINITQGTLLLITHQKSIAVQTDREAEADTPQKKAMRRCAARLLPLVQQQARTGAPLREAHDRDVTSLSRRACAAYYAGCAQQHERGECVLVGAACVCGRDRPLCLCFGTPSSLEQHTHHTS